jgi:hypothetical protein
VAYFSHRESLYGFYNRPYGLNNPWGSSGRHGAGETREQSCALGGDRRRPTANPTLQEIDPNVLVIEARDLGEPFAARLFEIFGAADAESRLYSKSVYGSSHGSLARRDWKEIDHLAGSSPAFFAKAFVVATHWAL